MGHSFLAAFRITGPQNTKGQIECVSQYVIRSYFKTRFDNTQNKICLDPHSVSYKTIILLLFQVSCIYPPFNIHHIHLLSHVSSTDYGGQNKDSELY